MLPDDGFSFSQSVNIILPKYELDWLLSEEGKKVCKRQIRELFFIIRENRKAIEEELKAIK